MNPDLDLNNWLEMIATNNAIIQEDKSSALVILILIHTSAPVSAAAVNANALDRSS